MSALTIGKLAKAADVKVPTIRFYEQIGLLPEPDRTANDRRVYGHGAVQRLAFIKHARQLGFPIDAIRPLLDWQTIPTARATTQTPSPHSNLLWSKVRSPS